MSNRDDDFNFDDDLFGDDDDDLRSGLGDDDLFADDDDDLFADDDDLFGQNDDELGFFDDDEEVAFGDEDDDIFGAEGLDEYDEGFLEEEVEEEEGGPNRTFVILAGLMIVFFIIGLGLVLFLVLRDEGPTDFDLTAQAIETENAANIVALQNTQTAAPQTAVAQETAAAETATQEAAFATETFEADIMNQTETAVAANRFATATAEFLTQEIISITETFEADEQQQSLSVQQTQTAEAEGDPTEAPVVVTPEPTVPGEEVEPPTGDSVAQTATALATVLFGGGDGDATPTPEEAPIGGPIDGDGQDGDVIVGEPQTALPDTGLFDDFGGTDNLALLALVAVGLVGVIFGARRLRMTNDKN